MRRSWSPQFARNMYNPFWITIIGIITFIVAFVIASVKNDMIHFVYIIGCYLTIVICIYLEYKRWDFGGYRTLTIDTEKLMLIFDNKVNIPFNMIEDISFEECEVPRRVLYRRMRLSDVVERLQEFNGFLVVKIRYGETINFSVPNRLAAKSILRCLSNCGFNTYLTKDTENSINNTCLIIGLIFLIPIILLFILWNL